MNYEFFIYPAVMKLRGSSNAGAHSPSSLSPEEKESLCRYLAANIGDIPTLRRILGIDPEEFGHFYPDMFPPSLSTDDTIDSFLSRFGDADAPAPQAASEIPADNPAYWLDNDSTDQSRDPNPDPTLSAIDSFLSKSAPHPQPVVTDSRVKTSANDTTPLKPAITEAAARILIKNHDYQAALKIIQQLSLNNPEKSVYFADQIRFLRKLILIKA